MRIKTVQAWWIRVPIEAARQYRSDFGQVKTFDAAILRSVPVGCCGWHESFGQGEDPTIAAALNAGQLIITTATGRRFVDAGVYYALSRILRRSVGYKTANDLVAMAAEYERDAKATLASCTAEIDVNGDGYPEYVFPLGIARVRRA